MTSAKSDRHPLDVLLSRYDSWDADRTETATIEADGGHIHPDTWHHSDDDAVELLRAIVPELRTLLDSLHELSTRIRDEGQAGIEIEATLEHARGDQRPVDVSLASAIADVEAVDSHCWLENGCHFSCTEADALIALFTALGLNDVAANLLEGHADSDDEDDAHYGMVTL